MIARENYQDIIKFLEYRKKIIQSDPATLRRFWGGLRHLLEWADATPFPFVQSIDLSFPSYLGKRKVIGKETPLSAVMLEKITNSAQVFFRWAVQEWPVRYSPITPNWIGSLRPGRDQVAGKELREPEAWSLDEILKVAALEIHQSKISLRRIQAALCFMYLSGMRITAFLTLSLHCVNMPERKIEQNPAKGVLTKKRKAAMTTFLNIPELWGVVSAWDAYVRQQVDETNSYWYARISRQGNALVPGTGGSISGRRAQLIREMHRICDLAGIVYKSPHKLRNGHATYGIKHAHTMEEFKAVSQNLMHASIATTDSIYANLRSDEIRKTIANLGNQELPTGLPPEIAQLLKALAFLKENPDIVRIILEKENGE